MTIDIDTSGRLDHTLDMRPLCVRARFMALAAVGVLGCSEAQESRGQTDAGADVGFWADVGMADGCPKSPPYSGLTCNTPGLKCFLPCTCPWGGYQAYCNPGVLYWDATIDKRCCSEAPVK